MKNQYRGGDCLKMGGRLRQFADLREGGRRLARMGYVFERGDGAWGGG